MARTKTIAPTADQRKTDDVVALAVDHLTGVAQIALFVTRTTGGRIIVAFPDPAITRLRRAPLGDDPRVGALVAAGPAHGIPTAFKPGTTEIVIAHREPLGVGGER